MKRTLLSAIVALMVAPALAQTTQQPPEIFSRALAHPESRQLFAFDFADHMEGAAPSFTRGRIDPSLPKGSRVTIYEATGRGYDAKEAKKRYERNAKGDIWCDNLSYGADGPVTETTSPPGTRTFVFTPVPKPNAKEDQRDLYRKLQAEMVVDVATSHIKVFTAHLVKSWKPVFVAKVDTVQLRGECAVAPNGRLYTAKLDTTLDGNVMGLGQTQSVRRVITNLAAVGTP
jgi:hypothetical protein